MAATAEQQQTATDALNNRIGSMGYALPSKAQYSPTTINPQNLQQIIAQYYGGATPAAAAQVGNTQLSPAAQFGGASPAAAAQVGNTQIGPSSLLNPSQISSITQGNAPDLSTNGTISQLLAGYQPEIRQQNSQLANQLAEFGLSGGPAVAAQNNLNTQQTQALAPSIASAIQNSQANQLNQGQFNSSQLINALTGNQSALNAQNFNQAQLNQQAGLSNQGALNSQSQLAAQLAQQAGLSNQSALNSQSQLGAQLNQAAGLSNQSALNSQSQLAAQLQQQAGLANADAANTANTANVGANNSTLAANTAAQNAAQQAYLQQLQSQWLDQFSAFNSINDASLGAQNQISVNGAQNFGTPSTSDSYAGLGSALSSIYSPTAKTAATVAK